ncbi:MAG: hypothetical protein NTZ05_17085, partial [Chloroflexi bacterium]|nr:hypothetical protein [Chloroflexota bacterium]
IGPFPANALALTWHWMTILGTKRIWFGGNLYHHEVGHILQQASVNDINQYQAAAIAAYQETGTHDNVLEREANCWAGFMGHEPPRDPDWYGQY